jgi:hypothetical protein
MKINIDKSMEEYMNYKGILTALFVVVSATLVQANDEVKQTQSSWFNFGDMSQKVEIKGDNNEYSNNKSIASSVTIKGNGNKIIGSTVQSKSIVSSLFFSNKVTILKRKGNQLEAETKNSFIESTLDLGNSVSVNGFSLKKAVAYINGSENRSLWDKASGYCASKIFNIDPQDNTIKVNTQEPVSIAYTQDKKNIKVTVSAQTQDKAQEELKKIYECATKTICVDTGAKIRS